MAADKGEVALAEVAKRKAHQIEFDGLGECLQKHQAFEGYRVAPSFYIHSFNYKLYSFGWNQHCC